MPLYEYRCGGCSRIFESYTRLSEEGKSPACPACGSDTEKIGIALFSAGGTGKGPRPRSSACGRGSRRSPFS